MRKTISAFLAVLAIVPTLAACTPAATTTTAAGTAAVTTAAATAAATTMKKMTVDEFAAVAGKEGYTIIDLRKAADVSVSTVKDAIAADLEKAVNGDAAAGVATLTPVVKDLKTKLILVCYTGNKYAQTATDALKTIGYDLNNVFTLEGGFKELSAKKPEFIIKK